MKTITDIRHKNLIFILDNEVSSINELAEKLGKSHSYVSQLKIKAKNIGDRTAREIEESLKKQKGWMDTDHSKQEDVFPRTPSEEDYVIIPQYTARGECGNGEMNEHVEIKGGLAFKREWISVMNLKEKTLEVVYAKGESMFPTLEHGEVVLIDYSQIEPRESKIFLIYRYGNGLVLKRMIRNRDGDWLYQSDNPSKTQFPDLYPLEGDEIRGMAVWRGGNI